MIAIVYFHYHRMESTCSDDKPTTYNLIHLFNADQVYSRNGSAVGLCVFGCQNQDIDGIEQ